VLELARKSTENTRETTGKERRKAALKKIQAQVSLVIQYLCQSVGSTNEIHLSRLMMMMIKNVNVNDKIPIDITPNTITRAPITNPRIRILRTESQVHRPRV
jgi:hypothetical protein